MWSHSRSLRPTASGQLAAHTASETATSNYNYSPFVFFFQTRQLLTILDDARQFFLFGVEQLDFQPKRSMTCLGVVY